VDSPLTKLIKSSEKGNINDLKVICDGLDIKVTSDKSLNELCLIRENEDATINIFLNPNLDIKSKFTFVAISLAEMLISPERILGRGIYYDVFFLREIHNLRSTKVMMLATRLAFPEGVIERIVNANNMMFETKFKRDRSGCMDVGAFISEVPYLPEFIRSVITGTSVQMLLNNKDIKYANPIRQKGLPIKELT